MKTISIPVAIFDGEPAPMTAEKLAEYPENYHGTLEVRHEKLTAGIVLAADAALNKNRELFQESFDGTLKAGVSEGFAYARAVEVITRTAKSWTVKNSAGETVDSLSEITAKTVEAQSTSFVSMVASRIEYPKIPTVEEIKAQGEESPPSTKPS